MFLKKKRYICLSFTWLQFSMQDAIELQYHFATSVPLEEKQLSAVKRKCIETRSNTPSVPETPFQRNLMLLELDLLLQETKLPKCYDTLSVERRGKTHDIKIVKSVEIGYVDYCSRTAVLEAKYKIHTSAL